MLYNIHPNSFVLSFRKQRNCSFWVFFLFFSTTLKDAIKFYMKNCLFTVLPYLQFLFHPLVSFVQHWGSWGYQDKITQCYCFFSKQTHKKLSWDLSNENFYATFIKASLYVSSGILLSTIPKELIKCYLEICLYHTNLYLLFLFQHLVSHWGWQDYHTTMVPAFCSSTHHWAKSTLSTIYRKIHFSPF